MIYIVRDRETGTPIEWLTSREDAEKTIAVFEKIDRDEGNLSDTFYEIQEMPDADAMIKDIRYLTGLSQNKFAQKYGIPIRTIENWESGSRVPPEYVIRLLGKVVRADLESVSGRMSGSEENNAKQSE